MTAPALDISEPTDYSPEPPALMLYGDPGSGKTTTATRALRPYFIRAEHGCPTYVKIGDTRKHMPGFPKHGAAPDWASILWACDDLISHKHDRKTLVIDTVNAAVDLCKDHVLKKSFGGSIQEFSNYSKGQGFVNEEWRKLLTKMETLRSQGILIIFLAHEGLVKQSNAHGEDYWKTGGSVYKGVWGTTSAFCDQVGNITKKTVVVKDGFKGKARGGNERVIIFEGTPSRCAKSNQNFEMPSEIACSWDSYLKANEGNEWLSHYYGDK